MCMHKNKNKSYHRLMFWSIALIVLFFAACTAWIYINSHKNINSRNKPSLNNIAPNGTSMNKSSPGGSSGSKAATNNSQRVIGGAINTNGQNNSLTPQGSWTSSSSGLIILHQPVNNSTLSNGAVINGTAKVSTVNYTLIDNKVGVISQGSLNVVNGVFSGKMIFSPQSNTGRLDVYSTNQQEVQLNEIEINVNFN